MRKKKNIHNLSLYKYFHFIKFYKIVRFPIKRKKIGKLGKYNSIIQKEEEEKIINIKNDLQETGTISELSPCNYLKKDNHWIMKFNDA